MYEVPKSMNIYFDIFRYYLRPYIITLLNGQYWLVILNYRR